MESWLCVCVCVGGGCDCHLFLLTRVHLPSHSWTRKGLPISQQLGLSANQAPAWLPTAGKVKSTGRRGSGGGGGGGAAAEAWGGGEGMRPKAVEEGRKRRREAAWTESLQWNNREEEKKYKWGKQCSLVSRIHVGNVSENHGYVTFLTSH